MTKHSENTEPSNSTKPVLVAVCPSCKGKNTIKKENRKKNGIIGSGFASWVVDSWYSCKDCGTRFDLIKQPLTENGFAMPCLKTTKLNTNKKKLY